MTEPVTNHTPNVSFLTSSGLSIDLWSNGVAGGWEPEDLATGLGGGEESIVLWASALARRGHRVRVYYTPRVSHADSQGKIYEGVRYFPRARFDPFASRNVLVTWKCNHPWRLNARCETAIHWSSDVETPWPESWLQRVKKFVVFTPYHRKTMPWVPDEQARVISLGVDLNQLNECQVDREPNLALYSSSPDRGLAVLLRDWPRIRKTHPDLQLEVCYGWDRFTACAGNNPTLLQFKRDMQGLMTQPGITDRGQVSRKEIAQAYWRANYWMLPLQRPESELFCLNAVKAVHCGTTPVVNPIGALQHTAVNRVDYQDFLQGRTTPLQTPGVLAQDWDTIIRDHWEPLFQKN